MHDMTLIVNSPSQSVKRIEAQIVKGQLDLIILRMLDNESLNGYEIISFVHAKFNIWLSAGTVYPLLNGLERKHLTSSYQKQGKRYYVLAANGKLVLKLIDANQDRLRALVDTIF